MTEGAESEIKVLTAAAFDKKVREAQNQVADGSTVLQKQDNNFHAAMLLIAKIEQTGVVWERPVIVFKLYRQNEWIDLSPGAGRPPSAGKVSVSSKPSQSQVWNSMEWLPLEGDARNKVGYTSHFLEKLGQSNGSPGKRSRTFNTILAKAGHPDRLSIQEISNRP